MPKQIRKCTKPIPPFYEGYHKLSQKIEKMEIYTRKLEEYIKIKEENDQVIIEEYKTYFVNNIDLKSVSVPIMTLEGAGYKKGLLFALGLTDEEIYMKIRDNLKNKK